ncbi:MAG: SoxR reducing system RseC family protein [Deltaproteobacteria bacterium]|nr:SoxR reducing system RseC family protein [Deltaproteobacteria bacterium]
MPHYEGLVTSLKEDGKAEVIIQPGSMGITGASPQVNRRVCHCATDGSTITIEVLNSVGAGVGDWVSVSRNATETIRNAAALLGIPIIGIIVGIILATFLTDGFSFRIAGGIIAMAACLLSGIAIGVLIFRRVSAGNQPVIDRIIKTRLEAASTYGGDQYPLKTGNKTCDTCAGAFSVTSQ